MGFKKCSFYTIRGLFGRLCQCTDTHKVEEYLIWVISGHNNCHHQMDATKSYLQHVKHGGSHKSVPKLSKANTIILGPMKFSTKLSEWPKSKHHHMFKNSTNFGEQNSMLYQNFDRNWTTKLSEIREFHTTRRSKGSRIGSRKFRK